jgi:two-component system sensor histidine kinase TctE
MRWGLRSQLLVLLLPGIALALAYDGWADHQSRVAAVDESLDEVLVQPLALLDRAIEPDPAGGVRLRLAEGSREVLVAMASEPRHFRVEALPPQGGAPRVLFGDEPLPLPGAAMAAAPGGAARQEMPGVRFYDGDFHGRPVHVALLQREQAGADGRTWRVQLQVAESTAQRARAREESLWRELRQGLRTLALAAVLLLVGLAWGLRPLERLRQQVARRPAGDLAPLPTGGVPHEVRPLVEAVNIAVGRSREVLAEQERFLADAAHQLRTPIAVMMAQVDYAKRAHDAAADHEVIGALAAPLARSRRIADQLLAISHAVSTATEVAEPVDLLEVAASSVVEALPSARQRGVDLGLADAPPQAVMARAEDAELHEILANLIHNALRHTPAGGRVTVSVRAEGDRAIADVIDSGAGLEPSRREAVFERFHSRSRTEGNAGAGLGLAIARAYARRRGGDVTLHDVPGGAPGLCARLVLPLAPAGRPD